VIFSPLDAPGETATVFFDQADGICESWPHLEGCMESKTHWNAIQKFTYFHFIAEEI